MKKILNNFYVKFTLLSLLVFVLIFIQMLYAENYTLDQNPVIQGLYFIIPLGALIHGFYTTRIYILDRLSFGTTRRQIYYDFVKRTVIVLIAVLVVILFYILMYLLIYSRDQFQYFINSKEIFYFVAIYLLCSALGFFQGIFKLNFKLALVIFIILAAIIVLVMVFGLISLLTNIIIIAVAIALYVVDYILIKKLNVKD